MVMKTSNVFRDVGEDPEKKEGKPTWEDMQTAIDNEPKPDYKAFMIEIRDTVKAMPDKATISMAGSMTILTMKEVLGLKDHDTIWMGGDNSPCVQETLFQRLWNIYIEIEGEDVVLEKLFPDNS
jgi:hypothetical protein